MILILYMVYATPRLRTRTRTLSCKERYIPHTSPVYIIESYLELKYGYDNKTNLFICAQLHGTAKRYSAHVLQQVTLRLLVYVCNYPEALRKLLIKR